MGIDDGTALVYWSVYASLNNFWDGGDALVATGNSTAMTAAEAARNVNFSGSWPATPDNYYLVARVSATDDATVDEGATAVTQTITAPEPADVDYTVPTITWSTGTTAGQTVTGNFDIDNVGIDDGTALVYWSVYASLNNFWDVGDALVATGNTIAMTAAEAAKNVNFSGSWPNDPDDYYLVARATASDDATTAENATAAPQTINPPDVDYTVVAVTPAGPIAVTTGALINESFDIDNTGTYDGTQLIYWNAYVSNNTTIDVNDTLVATGNTTAMTAAEAAKTITVNTGNWPASAGGPYYLLVEIAATDDVDPSVASNTGSSAQVTIDPPDVDYTITSVTPAAPTAVTEGAVLNESFNIDNTGTDDGTQLIYWNAYVSNNTTIDVNDTLVATGSTAAMTAAEAPRNIPVATGNWPASASGPYYLLVEIAADDDTDPSIASNTDFSSAMTITVSDPPDYEVTFATTLPWTGLVAGAIGGTPPRFVIQNISANPGLQPIDWSVYASKDMVLDATDTLIQSASTGALGASGSTNVDFAGNWPGGTGSYYWLIAVIDADDDSSPVNNTISSHAIAVADAVYVEGAEDNGEVGVVTPPPAQPAFINVSNTGLTLTDGGTIALEGTMDIFDEYDTYEFTAGADIAGVEMVARWQTGFDDLDLYLWPVSGNGLVSFDGSNDVEPADCPWAIIGLTATFNYYCGLRCWLADNTSGSTGKTYSVLLTGTPP